MKIEHTKCQGVEFGQDEDQPDIVTLTEVAEGKIPEEELYRLRVWIDSLRQKESK